MDVACMEAAYCRTQRVQSCWAGPVCHDGSSSSAPCVPLIPLIDSLPRPTALLVPDVGSSQGVSFARHVLHFFALLLARVIYHVYCI